MEKVKIWVIEEKRHWKSYEPRYAHKTQKVALIHMKLLRGLAKAKKELNVYRIETYWRNINEIR